MTDKQYNKIVLAYSGGLDTSVIIHWLKAHYNCEIIAVTANVGQEDELEGLEEKALKTGASKFYLAEVEEEFVYDSIFPTLKAGAIYENKYLLGTATARPVIAKALVDIAKQEGADAICHGCTGKGNDQVRFEMGIKALAPELDIIAPWRTWEITSREEAIDYAEKHEIPLKISRETNYSKDKNLWHLSHEGLDLEDPLNEPKYHSILEMSVTPEQAPDKPTYVNIDFEQGVPVAIDGKELGGVELIKSLNKIGGENAIGILDMIENRLVGMKSRGVYETPGGTLLYFAHEQLEMITLDKETLQYKQDLAHKYANIIYNGQYFTPLKQALDAFIDETQQTVTGTVKLKLYKGNMIVSSVDSPYSLYSEAFATFDDDDVYNQGDAAGFINLYGLSSVIHAEMKKKTQLAKQVNSTFILKEEGIKA
ncbi:argininosuccinate synthase [Marinilactibacillus psychrotolerans]|uniref:Argininosuccinate synthase n=1 Tax=Marinilactibacillus psychrotolerans TaxID=191770 RepID=A0AAV3WUF6_9LACT|nr:argininosuccinate synthase [Marinilactibacillus psychrotolerans]GEL67640.1 argininosuccinate synthase [Marinilactibacillus psychrotolerans]GEQ36510.1 argininosuccinate synthase [Marinilactibacillus psychrotolerans]SDD13099.1 argininosuccinate synthase [Marinilactibacillus psychrotolerans]